MEIGNFEDLVHVVLVKQRGGCTLKTGSNMLCNNKHLMTGPKGKFESGNIGASGKQTH